jgi:hypothetical protein
VGYYAIGLLIGAGALLFLALVLELSPPSWSRLALLSQGLALLLALLLTHGHPHARLVLYPLLLAGGIYLWDTTLPPPSPPEGPLRQIVPRLLLVGLLTDYLITLRRAHLQARRPPLFRGDRVPLAAAARILHTTEADVRVRLHQAGRTTSRGVDGNEELTLDDLIVLLLRQTLANGRK